MASPFSLAANPFHLISVSVRSRREDVVAACENTITDGSHDEAELLRAQQALLTPRSRIDAEVAWLSGMSPAQARVLVGKLVDGKTEEIEDAFEQAAGLDKANLAADLCCQANAKPLHVEQLVESYETFNAGTVEKSLNEIRQVSAFGKVDPTLLAKSLATLRDRHAKAAMAALTASAHPGKEMTSLVEKFIASNDSNVRQLIEAVAKEYDSWSEPHLRKIGDRIKAQIATLRDTPNDSEAVSGISALLDTWDEFSQPVQLVEQARGHDEPRSKEIYRELRDLCIWLANEMGAYDQALAISKALLKTFPELPQVHVEVSRELNLLESLAAQARAAKILAPLIEAAEAASAALGKLDSDLMAGGFGPSARGLAKALYEAFIAIAATTMGTESAGMPWAVVRSVAISLNNEEDSPDGSLTLLDGILAFTSVKPPEDVLTQLRIDRRTVYRNIRFRELTATAKNGDVRQGLQLVDELLEGAEPGEELQGLLQFKSAFERKSAARTRTLLGWGVMAAIAIVAIAANNDESSTSPNYLPTPLFPLSTTHPSSQTVPPDNVPGPLREPTFTPEENLSEEIPPVGRDNVLGANQIRYCLYQDTRLERVRELVDNDRDIVRFNALIEDYNSRCSSFRYREGVLQAVQAEVPGRKNQLQAEAKRTVDSWNMTRVDPETPEELIDLSFENGAGEVQLELWALGHYRGPIGGGWNAESSVALRDFKRSVGLPNDEEWNMATQTALMAR